MYGTGEGKMNSLLRKKSVFPEQQQPHPVWRHVEDDTDTDVGQAAADLLVLLLLLIGIYLSIPVAIKLVRYWRHERLRIPSAGSKKIPGPPGAGPDVSIRQQLAAYVYVHTNFGLWMDIIQAALSIVSFIILVAGSYRELGTSIPTWEFVVEILLATYFLFDFFSRFYLASDRLQFYLSTRSFVDFITIAPVFVGLLIEHIFGGISLGSEGVRRAIQVFRIFRAIRIIRLARLAPSHSLRQRIFYLAVTVFSIVLVATAFYQAFETIEAGEIVPFHEALYFMTSVVIGRPVAPVDSVFTFLFLVIVVLVAVTSIPIILAQVVKLWVETSDRKTYTGRFNHQHILLCGDCNPARLRAFLVQLIHPARDPIAIPHVVVLSPLKMEGELRNVLDDHNFGEQVTYIRGNPQSEADLDRAGTYAASTCIVLAHRNATMDPVTADGEVVATCLAVKRYAPEIRVYAQVRRHRARQHLLGLSGWNTNDTSISVANLSMTLMGVGLLVPALPTLLTNIVHQGRKDNKKEQRWVWKTMLKRIRQHFQSMWYRAKRIEARKGLHAPTSVYVSEELRLPSSARRGQGGLYIVEGSNKIFSIDYSSTPRLPKPEEMPEVLPIPPRLHLRTPAIGQEEYLDGFSQELYEIPLTAALEGRSFAAAARWLYMRFAVILIGAKVLKKTQNSVQNRALTFNTFRSKPLTKETVDIKLFPSSLQLEQVSVISLYLLAYDDEVVDLVEKQTGSRYVKLRGAYLQKVAAEMVHHKALQASNQEAYIEFHWTREEHLRHQIEASARYYQDRGIPPLVAYSIATAEYDGSYPWPHDLVARWRKGALEENAPEEESASPLASDRPHPLYDKTVRQPAHLSTSRNRRRLHSSRSALKDLWATQASRNDCEFDYPAGTTSLLNDKRPVPAYPPRHSGQNVQDSRISEDDTDENTSYRYATGRPTEERLTLPSNRSVTSNRTSQYSGHILICGANENVGLLLRAIRAFDQSPFSELGENGEVSHTNFEFSQLPVVILCPTHLRPDAKILDHMHGLSSAFLADVEWVDGSPLEIEELVKAGALSARASAVLTTRQPSFVKTPKQSDSAGPLDSNVGLSLKEGSVLSEDIDAIAVASLLHKLNPSLHILTELVQGANASYVRPMGTDLSEAGERTSRFVENLCRTIQMKESSMHHEAFSSPQRYPSRTHSIHRQRMRTKSSLWEDKNDGDDSENSDWNSPEKTTIKRQESVGGSTLLSRQPGGMVSVDSESDTSEAELEEGNVEDHTMNPLHQAQEALARNTSEGIAHTLASKRAAANQLSRWRTCDASRPRSLLARLYEGNVQAKWHDVRIPRIASEPIMRQCPAVTCTKRRVSHGDIQEYFYYDWNNEGNIETNVASSHGGCFPNDQPTSPSLRFRTPTAHRDKQERRQSKVQQSEVIQDTGVLLERPQLDVHQKRIRLRKTQEDIFGAAAFASGRVFSGTTLDALLSEQYFNVHAIALMKQLVRASRKQKLIVLNANEALYHMHHYCATAVPWEDLQSRYHTLWSDASRKEHSHSHILYVKRTDEQSNALPSLKNWKAPETTFGEIFETLLRGYNLLSLGLYRRVSPFDADLTGEGNAAYPLLNREDLADLVREKMPKTASSGYFKNSDQLLSYVFTNPRPDTLLGTDDLLYVLRPEE